MAAAFVVYVNSDPQNVVGLFFQQNFPSGKTAQQAAVDYAASLPVAADVRPAKVSSYQLVTDTTVTL